MQGDGSSSGRCLLQTLAPVQLLVLEVGVRVEPRTHTLSPGAPSKRKQWQSRRLARRLLVCRHTARELAAASLDAPGARASDVRSLTVANYLVPWDWDVCHIALYHVKLHDIWHTHAGRGWF